MYDAYDREPAVLCDLCKHKHCPDDDCPDDGLCLVASCDKRATKSGFSDSEFQYCAEHFATARWADND